jgi:predicted  nucleic acid-binding Zn-ribbon protein
MAKSLNIVIGADIEKLREGFNKAIQVVQSSGKRMSDDVAKSAKSMEERLAAIATRNPTMGSVRQLSQLAMEARALGPEFAKVANEIIKEAGRMKDSIGDTRAEVGYFASDTRRLDAVLGGIQGMAGAFSAVQGAMALAGVENKDLQATMVKLQGAMALVSGLQAVQNTLQQESAAVQGFLALRTTVLTAAQTAYTTASAGAIGTQRALNIAMAAAPWALAIAAISAIVISIASYADKIKKVSAEQKLFNEINSETQKNFEEEVKSVSGLLAVVNNHNASMKERRNALAEIQKIYPDFLANQSLDKVSSE